MFAPVIFLRKVVLFIFLLIENKVVNIITVYSQKERKI